MDIEYSMISPVPLFRKYIELLFANDDLWMNFQHYIRENSDRDENKFYEFRRDPKCISTWLEMLDNMGGGWPLSLFAAAAFVLMAYRDAGHDLDAELAALHAQKHSGKTESTIELHQAGILDLQADAIVNAANPQLREGGGVCGAIFKAADSDLLREACKKIGYCEEGSAVATPAFGLKNCRCIIHAVGPRYAPGDESSRKLLWTYRNALGRARDNCCHSIVFPLIATGSFGFPVEEGWKIAFRACMIFIKEDPSYTIDIRFAIPKASVLDIGKRIMPVETEGLHDYN